MLKEAGRRRLVAGVQDIFIYELVYSLFFKRRSRFRRQFLQPRLGIAQRDARSFLQSER